MHHTKHLLQISLLVIATLAITSCGTTRTENGVTIDEGGSWNPLDWF